MSNTQQNWAVRGRTLERHWTSVPNEIIRCPDISPISKVIWVILHGYAPHFIWTKETLASQSGAGGHQMRKAFRELQEFGLLERSPRRLENGQIAGWEWTVHETIHRHVENLQDGEQPSGRFLDENSAKTYQTVEPAMSEEPRAETHEKIASKNTKEEQENNNTLGVLCMEFTEFESMCIEVLHGVNLAHPPMRALEVLQKHKRDEVVAALRQTAKATRPSWAYFAAVLQRSSGGKPEATTELEREQARMYKQIRDGGGVLTERQAEVLRKVEGGSNG